MNILCVCRGGNVRSVAAKMILHRYFGHQTLAAGWENNDESTFDYLSNWADRIVVMNEEFKNKIPSVQQDKIIVLHVGNDIWGDPYNEDLQSLVFNEILKNSLLVNRKNPSLDKVLEKIRDYKEKLKSRNICDAST